MRAGPAHLSQGVILLGVLFTLLVPSAFLTDETKTLIRALAWSQGCRTPAIAAVWKPGGQMEVTVSCREVGDDGG